MLRLFDDPGEIHAAAVNTRVEGVLGSALNRELQNLRLRAGIELKRGQRWENHFPG